MSNNTISLTTNFEENVPASNIIVYNMLGQVQFKKEITNISKGLVKNNFAISSLSPGVYLVGFSGGGKDIMKKMVVLK